MLPKGALMPVNTVSGSLGGQKSATHEVSSLLHSRLNGTSPGPSPSDCAVYICADRRAQCNHYSCHCSAASSSKSGEQFPSSNADRKHSQGSEEPLSRGSQRSDHNASWAHFLLNLPLEVAAAGARTNALWLKKRKRSHWWSRQEFPRVGLPIEMLKICNKSLQLVCHVVRL